tara:strand:- start:46 stop:246 length:201 start_codon:yes stop_codon:yes gene_type:complete
VKLIIYIYAFSSNADISDGVVFGKKIEVWLIYTLIFFGLTSLGFVWTWVFDLFKNFQMNFFKKPLD